MSSGKNPGGRKVTLMSELRQLATKQSNEWQKGKAIPLSGEAGQEASEALNGESWPPGVEVQLRQGKSLRIDFVGIRNRFFSILYV